MTDAKRYLDMAARAALRAAGDVEPNPLVGAAIVKDGLLLALAHHRRFGGPHAEVEALESCRARGADPRGATMYVTLEPCNHHGKTPPCTDAIAKAGIARVVCARQDPNPQAAGGAEALRKSGIAVEFTDVSPLARSISDPFVKRITTGLPWVIAKWAQTMDGYIADRKGESKWISGEPSRRRVHRLRARVDAILTAIGTIATDDPMLTARDVARVRRVARRVVVDRDLKLPLLDITNDDGARLVATAREVPVTVCCRKSRAEKRGYLEERGVEVVLVKCVSETNDLDFTEILRMLAEQHNAATVLIEGGAGLLTRLFYYDMVDEAMVFIAPRMLNDGKALSPITSGRATPLSRAMPFRLHRLARSGEDALMVYRRIRESRQQS